MGHSVDGQSDPVLHSDFTHELRDMGLHCSLFDLELQANFAVGTSRDQQTKHFAFPLADLVFLLRG